MHKVQRIFNISFQIGFMQVKEGKCYKEITK